MNIMKLSKPILKKIVRAISDTRSDEIACNECFRELDRFVDLELAGKSAEEALPLVKHHLDHCMLCREEYEALLEALKVTKKLV